MKLEGSEKKEYLAFVRKESPKTKHLKTMTRAFFLGGLICCIGQGINDLIKYLAPSLTDKIIASYTLLIIITITAVLTGLGIYD